ncbi:winged helix-turn-helix domain-containing protein [Rhizobium sp. 1399]|uniref:winged helix-turn-helix domain-containing tetratricopeptide repeat protein n=1 Tax=Rhizobium sp. 1399 TaxID=2817758 RepID=UPI0028666854|nr:winged helix-turn-helix domain-containing protein [Rhizobium sp. 1399]MDR6670293.1 adenylate cyclase [Rhizobium sp. 1399]
MRPERIYEFAGHSLDLGRGRLQRGKEDVALRPKSLALLAYLLENPGRVLDKEELIAAVWPTSIVTDDSLSQCLKDIRGALGAAAEGFIRTVPRRGYIVDAENIQSRSRLPARQSEKPSIAVLPFRPLASDREHYWFAEGLTEDIATALTRSRQLTVISPLSRSAEPAASANEAAEALGVRYAVDGSVRLAGERLRVSARLVDVLSGTILWADRFDRYLSDVFAIQDEITGATVRHLELELLPEDRRALQLSRTENMEAYTYYRHGWQLARHWSKEYLLVARRMFMQAVELDPAFARAHSAAALCDCFLLEWLAGSETPQSILALADKALALDPSLAEAHVTRGLAFQRLGRLEEGRAAYSKALAIDPTCYEARLFAGFLARMEGEHEIAKAHFFEAAQLRPDDYLGPYFVLGEVDLATSEKLVWAQLTLELAERAAVLQPENPAPLSRGAVALVHLGRLPEAFAWTRRALVLDPDDPVTCCNTACIYSMAGDQETAMRYLEVYVRQSSEDMIGLIRHDRTLDGIRSHPDYEALVTTGWRPRFLERAKEETAIRL